MNDFDKGILASGIASLVAGCMLYTLGCEDRNARKEPELQAAKVEAVDYINAAFGTAGQADRIGVMWGDQSQCWATDTIEIDRTLKGNPSAIQAHMRHEVFHAITDYDDTATHYNGVRIADKIAWRNT